MPAVVEAETKVKTQPASIKHIVGEDGTAWYEVKTPMGHSYRLSDHDPIIMHAMAEEVAAIVNESQTDRPLNLAEKVTQAFARRGIEIQSPIDALDALLTMMQKILAVEKVQTEMKGEDLKQAAADAVREALRAPRNRWGVFGDLNDPTKQAARMIMEGVVVASLEDVVTEETVDTARRIVEVDTILVSRGIERIRLVLEGMGQGAGTMIGDGLTELGEGVGLTLGRMVGGTWRGLKGESRSLPAR